MLNERLVRWLSRPMPRTGKNFDIDMPISIATDIGCSRKENQDRVAVMRVNTMSASSKTFAVVAIADGMGGMKDGAGCATRTISSFFNALIRFRQKHPLERLKLAAELANTEVAEFAETKGGATLSAVLLTADQGIWSVNVGDSRIYALHQKKSVNRLTVDDSLAEALGGHGRELLQFIGMGLGIAPHVSQIPIDATRLLITSDGVHFIAQEVLNEILRSAPTREAVATQLLDYANWRGAPDNATLAVIDPHELVAMLPSIEESGIELWNSFSELHVMWLRPNQVEQSEADFRSEQNLKKHDQERFYSPNDRDEFYNRDENAPFYQRQPSPKIERVEVAEETKSQDEGLAILTSPPSEEIQSKDLKKTTKSRSKPSTTTVRKKRPAKTTTKKPSSKSKNVQLSIDVDTPKE